MRRAPFLHRVGGKAIEAIGAFNPCRIDETIVIAGVPRSGTTWLLEILQTLSGYKALNEPLSAPRAFNRYGFSWRTYIPPEGKAERQRAYIEKALTGRLGVSGWKFDASSRPLQLVEHATRDRLIVKFCRLNRMFHWFLGEFDTRATVLLMRHPCAVVASMLNHGSWNEEGHLDVLGASRAEQALHGGELPPSLEEVFRPVLDRISTQVEVLATMWCLDHYIPLIHHPQENNGRWLLVTYERLVTEGEAELNRIAEEVGVKVSPEMLSYLESPSASVKDKLRQDPYRQLAKWRDRLTGSQVKQVLSIVEEVGLADFYTDQLEPSKKRIAKFY